MLSNIASIKDTYTKEAKEENMDGITVPTCTPEMSHPIQMGMR